MNLITPLPPPLLSVILSLSFILLETFPTSQVEILTVCACDPEQDSLALVDIYNATQPSTGNWSNDWDLQLPMSTFYGVTLNINGCVSELNLAENNLGGTLPNAIGNLPELTLLALQGNAIDGDIPTSIGNLTQLTNLQLNDNQLDNTIPEEVGNLTLLTNLDLAYNTLSGNIPESIGLLKELTYLELSGNSLTGGIPDTLGTLPNLGQLRLGSNPLGGSIPETLGQLTMLHRLILYGCNLIGTLPDTLRNIPEMRVVDLTSNNLTGVIPNWIGTWTELEILSLRDNDIGGSIPTEIGLLGKLRELFLDGCLLEGTIPTSFANLVELEKLELDDNQLTGTLPNVWNNFPKLVEIDFSNNQFSGPIPATMGQLSALQKLYLHDNKFSGSILNSFGSLNQLQIINLHNNQLTGNIPSELGDLFNTLTELQLHNNQLEGSIPSSLGNLINLTQFSLYQNQLTGAIPSSIGQLTLLTELNMSFNQLSGAIPTTLGNLSGLTKLDLSNNQLELNIPPELSDLNTLLELDLDYNQLTGPIDPGIVAPLMTKLDLAYNLLSDTIPASIFNLTTLRFLRLNNNQLSGKIPPPSDLDQLEEMFLSYNQLSDTLPPTFNPDNLGVIEELYMDNNQISGKIPSGMGQLSKLRRLDLSVNQLEGEIPFADDELPELEAIYLGKNMLTGNIPNAFGTFINLVVLDLQSNFLEGEIPENLGDIPNINDLYLSGNQLSGCIPQSWFNLCDRGADVTLSNNELLLNDDFDAFCAGTGDGAGACLTNFECDLATLLPLNEDPCGRNYRAVKLNNATTSVPAPSLSCNATYVGNDAWFKVVLPESKNFLIKNDSVSTILPTVEAYKGADCNDLTPIRCSEIDSIPYAFAIQGDVSQQAGDTVWLRVWDQNNTVISSGMDAVVALTAHLLPSDKEAWELCDFPVAVLNDTLTFGSGNRVATQFLVIFDSTATSTDIEELKNELESQNAALINECPCGKSPLQLWSSENTIEMETDRRVASSKSRVDTSNYNYLLEVRDFIGNSFTLGQQVNSSAAIDENGNYFLSWQDNGRYRYAFNLYGQAFNATGERLGPEFKIYDAPVGGQENPDLAMEPGGSFVEVWMEGKSLGRKEVNGRLFDANGSPNGALLEISSPQSGYNPKVAMANDGSFVVTWQAPDNDGFGIYARRFDPTGQPLAQAFQINTFTNGNQISPEIAMNQSGEFAVVWQGSNQDGNGNGIFGALFNELGSLLSGPFQVNTFTTGDQNDPSIAINNQREMIVSWQSFGQDGSGNGIYAQRFDASGTPINTEIQVNTTTTDEQARPAISMYEDGGFFITWESFGQDGSAGGIFAQLFDPEGNKLNGEIPINTVTEGTQLNPSVAMNQSGDIIISWESYGQDGSGQGIFGQQFQTVGTGVNRTVGTSNEAKLAAGYGLLKRFSEVSYIPNNPQYRTIVAVTDTGIEDDHPELANAIWVNEEANDNDNCVIGDLIGYDFKNKDGNPDDTDGHGTGVNGSIVNDFPDDVQLELMNLKFYEDQKGTVFDGICGIYYAVDQGADIINLSWGFESDQFPQILYDALAYAAERNVLLVASAGNTSKDNDQIKKYPANFDLPNLIVATAYQIDEDSTGIRLANYASYGDTTVDLAARGYIQTTALGAGLDRLAGTSLAAPAVSRTAAAIKGRYPTLTAEEIKGCILNSVDPIAGFDTLVASGGVLNHTAALACAAILESSCRSTNFFIDTDQTQNKTYQTTGIVTTNAVITSGTNTIIEAGQSVRLIPGFQVQSGATFIARIEDCTQLTQPKSIAVDDIKTIRAGKQPTIAKKEQIKDKLIVVPNPATHLANLEFESPSSQEVLVSLHDLNGRLLQSKRYNTFRGGNSISWPVNHLPMGVYLLRILMEGQVMVGRLVIER